MTTHIPALRSAILEHALFTSAFDRTSYEAIYSRLGALLDITKTYIDKVVSDPNHAPETVQAVIDQATTTLAGQVFNINLPWIIDTDEVPFWRGLVESARVQLEMYAEYAPKSQIYLGTTTDMLLEDDGTDILEQPVEADPANPPAPTQGCC